MPELKSLTGEKTLKVLEKMGINSIEKLIFHFPIRYEDETKITMIADISLDCECQIEGIVQTTKVLYGPKRQVISDIYDDTGLVRVRLFYFFPNQLKILSKGNRVRLFGKPKIYQNKYEFIHPRFKKVESDTPFSNYLTPVYSLKKGITQHQIRKLILKALKLYEIQDTIPKQIRDEKNYDEISRSVQHLHLSKFDKEEDLKRFLFRIQIDELIANRIMAENSKKLRKKINSPKINFEISQFESFIKLLPFSLTNDQKKVIHEINQDYKKPNPMNRILQGDVGSGKTIVSLISMLPILNNGLNVAYMAPTEILAKQIFENANNTFKNTRFNLLFLSSSTKKKDRKEIINLLSSKGTYVIIGTHSLIQEEISFEKVGLIIVDEQHRFGVGQRYALRKKTESNFFSPHQLMMTATPIPRSLHMAIYGDLDFSTIKTLPENRLPKQTRIFNEKKRDELITKISDYCDDDNQVFWVCPKIEIDEDKASLTSAEWVDNYLKKNSKLKVGLLHGKLKFEDKALILSEFKEKKIDVLVSTSVIEVGIDCPNANMIVIEHAERWGLSQLHQLRGRVGRGTKKGICILLFKDGMSEVAKKRLDVFVNNDDGFVIAEEDLKIRGSGDMFGVDQSGEKFFRFFDISILDNEIIREADEIAKEMVKSNKDNCRRHLERWFALPEGFSLV